MMDSSALLKQVVECIVIPPGLPSDNPTVSSWQKPPSSIANIQSASLPQETDIVVIGSGVTGCSVVHTLLHHPDASGQRITLIEARGLVSGATGRNGGHLVSDTPGLFQPLVEGLGAETALEILRFSEANIRRLKEVVAQLDDAQREASELRSVIATSTVSDEEAIKEAKANIELLRKMAPDSDLKCSLVGGEEGLKKYNYGTGVAVLEEKQVAALWPYRLFTALLENLLRDFKDRFTLEANTAVVSVEHADSRYRVNTKRGLIMAKKVIHCTNGYAAHLLPGLVGKLYPLRGTMSVQKPADTFPRLGDFCSWTHLTQPSIDLETGVLTSGLYYAQQNCRTGDIWIGGESQPIQSLLNSDDTVVSCVAKDHIFGMLPKIFKDAAPSTPVNVWSGIMGFTGDNFPLVGRLPPAISGREGGGEWIAAGYNGHGMDKAWLSGEAVARMALGEETPSWLPKPYRISEERLRPHTAEFVAKGIFEKFSK